MNKVLFPDLNALRFWMDAVAKSGLSPYLPDIDDAWFDQMLSAFSLTKMRPDCQEDVCKAGAVIFHKITKNHYRVDGNKRSAVLSTYLFFILNSTHLDISPNQLYTLAKTIAESTSSPEVIVQIICEMFGESCKTIDA